VSSPRARRRFLAATLAVVAAVVVAMALALGPRRREAAAPAQPIAGWQPRAATIPDGGCAPAEEPTGDGGNLTRFAAIGDYGYAGPAEEAVADLVKGFRPDFVVTLGDNNYPLGAAETIDFNVGLFYHDFIAPYLGRFGCGAGRNRFFPALGNHDWYAPDARPYLDYFTLPGNERYYDVTWGWVHVFALDSDSNEPDGITAGSVQAAWLKRRLATSTARWKVVYMHHPPYSSGPHGSTVELRWPYKEWGADLVLAGHDHDYERFDIDGLPYLVNGLGGAAFYAFGATVAGSVARFNESAGALFVEADASSLHARFQSVDGRQLDAFSLAKP
jgi:tartrate-resistant acid phosphatase type 5